MKTISIRFSDMDKKTLLYLGYVGENLHRRIIFDAGSVFAEYPDAVPSLTVAPHKTDPYPAIISRDGNWAVWDVMDHDLTVEGLGFLQLSFTEGEVIVKTVIARIRIYKSLMPNGEIPDPIDDWLTRAEKTLEEIPETIDRKFEDEIDYGNSVDDDDIDGEIYDLIDYYNL